MLKGKSKGLDEDEEAIRPQDKFVQERFFWPRLGEPPLLSDQTNLAWGERSQIMTGFLVFSQIISSIRRAGESIKDALDIVFGSTGDYNFQPQSTCGRASQKAQEGWATTIVAAFVECVNDKDKGIVWAVRKAIEKVKKE